MFWRKKIGGIGSPNNFRQKKYSNFRDTENWIKDNKILLSQGLQIRIFRFQGQVHQIFLGRKNNQILEVQKIEVRTKKFPSLRDPKSEFWYFRDRCTNFFIIFLKNLVHLSLKSENSDLGSLGEGNFFVLTSIFCISKIWIFFLPKNIWCTYPSNFFSWKQYTFVNWLLYWNLRSLAIIVLELIIRFTFTSGVKFGEVAETFHLTT